MHVQSVGTTAGALHNTLTSIDYLLSHLETRCSQPGTKHFIASLNVSWLKLKKYYEKTDLNPAYVMAVFLNPHFRQHWFNEHWEPPFIKVAIATIKEQFLVAQRLYNIDVLRMSVLLPAKEASGFAAYNKLSSCKVRQPQDELARYIAVE
jgi:hypothetical protein